MHPNAPKLLEDIRDAAAFIVELAENLTLERFAQDRVVRQAVERNFEIIGEALIRLSKVDEATTDRIGPVAEIKAFRNILVHAYDSIDHEIVWDIIQKKLPTLLRNVEELLAEAADGEEG